MNLRCQRLLSVRKGHTCLMEQLLVEVLYMLAMEWDFLLEVSGSTFNHRIISS